ncbi:hypothetical protein L7F22_030455 [Adiantum nelumboides]|nr:hypothetical protein [Adiantum nelumboides]
MQSLGKVRDQQALIFFDNVAKANFISPELATLGVKPEEMGPQLDASLAAPGHEVAVRPLIGKLRQPVACSRFDTIVTNNIFGDILSDEASMLTGSIGMLPSASVKTSGPGLFEPIHGSAPDIAGQDKANPLAMILSAAMLLKYGLGEVKAAERIEKAVIQTLDKGFRTGDIMSAGKKLVGCTAMGREVISALQASQLASVRT